MESFKHCHSAAGGYLEYIHSKTENASVTTKPELHSHSGHLEVYYFISGSLRFVADGKGTPVAGGDMLILSNGVLHRPMITAPSTYERKHIQLDVRAFGEMGGVALDVYREIKKKRVLFVPGTAKESRELAELYLSIENAAECGRDTEALSGLLYLLSRAVGVGAELSDAGYTANGERAVSIMQYIDDNLGGDLSYSALASRFYLSEKALYSLFLREVGVPLGDYVAERRIVAAKSMLEAGDTAGDVAYAVGFRDYSVFYRSFKRRLGVSPREYQRALGKELQ